MKKKIFIPFYMLFLILVFSQISADSNYEAFLFKPCDILNKEVFIQKVSSPDELLYPYLGNVNTSITNEEIALILNDKILTNPTYLPYNTNGENIYSSADFNLLSDEEKMKCVISNRDFLCEIYPDFLAESKGDEINNNVNFKIKFNKLSSNDRISYEINLLINDILNYKKFKENMKLLDMYFVNDEENEKELNSLANYLDTQNKVQKIPLNIFSFKYDSSSQEVIVHIGKKKKTYFTVEKEKELWKITDTKEFINTIELANSLLIKKKGK